jgi:hypothetical protein
MSRDISNSQDVMDSRDVIERHEEMTSERQGYVDEITEREEGLADVAEENADERSAAQDDLDAAREALKEWDEENGDELKALSDFVAEGENSAEDWTHGATLIRDSYFEDYAQELAEDLNGKAIRDAQWPFSCIDWTKAAEELQQDYTSIEFDGVTYWVR